MNGWAVKCNRNYFASFEVVRSAYNMFLYVRHGDWPPFWILMLTMVWKTMYNNLEFQHKTKFVFSKGHDIYTHIITETKIFWSIGYKSKCFIYSNKNSHTSDQIYKLNIQKHQSFHFWTKTSIQLKTTGADWASFLSKTFTNTKT